MSETESALYRKYRPQTFADVRNQDHIVKVLEGAIKKQVIPHALLFTGSRGTGKTTVARIFAREIGAHEIDIYEIDAASNRGIDDIRELRDAVHTLPYESSYKVYIIDEVHMLTKEAFNALLKTLEEPPKHVIFILATTERDKLLDTITSRCQVFEFRAPSRAVLEETVLAVAKKEKFKLDNAGAGLIAIAADGSFRDALGITQKVIMASDDAVADTDEIAQIIGAPKNELLMRIIDALQTKSVKDALGAIEAAVASNVDMRLFIRLLLERIRAIILTRHGGGEGDKLIEEFGAADGEKMMTYAKDASSPIHSHLLGRLLVAAEETRFTFLPHLPLELAVIDLCSADTQK